MATEDETKNPELKKPDPNVTEGGLAAIDPDPTPPDIKSKPPAGSSSSVLAKPRNA